MKEALYYKKLENHKVQCVLCPRKCIILENNIGNCGARKNIKGKLYSLVYGKAASYNIDPIEKKPLYHFLPGSSSFSFGTVGCNLHCFHCQNWQISQAKADEFFQQELMPADIIKLAIKNKCESISYTYNEPTVFYEYMIETAKLAKKKNLKNVIVSNGYINEEPLKKLCRYIDAANIDLKSINNDFYKKICSGAVEQVLNSLKTLQKNKVWIEITNLIIPGENDNLKDIEKLCRWIKENLGINVPLHFSAFYPTYKMPDKEPTNASVLFKARDVALKQGINYVYAGNVFAGQAGNTYCPKCKKLLIERGYMNVYKNNIKNNKCIFCGEKIAGVFD